MNLTGTVFREWNMRCDMTYELPTGEDLVRVLEFMSRVVAVLGNSAFRKRHDVHSTDASVVMMPRDMEHDT